MATIGFIYLVHDKGVHTFGFADTQAAYRKAAMLPVVRTWEDQTEKFLAYLKKQKHPERYCPLCNPTAEHYGEKWGEAMKPLSMEDANSLA